MTVYLASKTIAEQNPSFVFLGDNEKFEKLNELFGLSSLSRQLNRLSDIEKRIDKFLEFRDQFVNQLKTYNQNIEIIYEGTVPKPYILTDLCEYLIKNAGLSRYLYQGTSMIPKQDHEIIFIGDIKPKKNTVIIF